MSKFIAVIKRFFKNTFSNQVTHATVCSVHSNYIKLTHEEDCPAKEGGAEGAKCNCCVSKMKFFDNERDL